MTTIFREEHREQLNRFKKMKISQLCSHKTIEAIGKYGIRSLSNALAKEPHPFLKFLSKQRIREWDIPNLDIFFDIYNRYGLGILLQAEKLHQETGHGMHYMLDFLINQEVPEIFTVNTFKDMCNRHNFKMSELSMQQKIYHLRLDNIYSDCKDDINSYFEHDVTPVLLHGNPFLNKKFKIWAQKMKGTEPLHFLEKNIQYIIKLFEIIKNKKMNDSDYYFMADCILKSNIDKKHLMAPFPDLYVLIDSYPLFDYKIESIRDLFFDKDRNGYAYNKDSFNYYRSYFLEEGLEQSYEPIMEDSSEYDIFF